MLWQPLVPKHQKAQGGFTLLELIVVMIILGVLAVYAIPRFSGTTGYDEYAFQNRLVSVLRNMQIRAMQDSRPSFCHRVNFINTSTQTAFGPSSASFASGNEAATCTTTIDFNTDSFLRTTATEIQDANVSMSVLDGSVAIGFIQFDSFGAPQTTSSNCSNGCTVSFSGEATARVCIASEGFINAC
ncbi:type II secretion system protein [Alteromonas sp. W364]|uniref:type II secretion system protein n=1 Tax=Alteromonas sp. W364 TaxID=3075610 RepID=UPI0028863A96|nr:type II secretion system protein [Alteromonas sp. W364]MDT0627800.1 type II secretion system protein [Alteromonas sp. W364]